MAKIQTAAEWAAEGLEKYGLDAEAWLRRWKTNCQNFPEDLEELDAAIEIVRKEQHE